MTPMLAELHRAHIGRLQRFRSAAVPDDGIDFKRAPRHIILRDVVAPQPSIMHVPPVVMVPFKRVKIAPPTKPVSKAPPAIPFRKAFSIRQIINDVADHHGMLSVQLTGPERFAILIKPRFMAMYLCKAILNLSTPAIGRHFGGRDHSTAINALNKARSRALSDFQFGSELAAIECAIRRRNP